MPSSGPVPDATTCPWVWSAQHNKYFRTKGFSKDGSVLFIEWHPPLQPDEIRQPASYRPSLPNEYNRADPAYMAVTQVKHHGSNTYCANIDVPEPQTNGQGFGDDLRQRHDQDNHRGQSDGDKVGGHEVLVAVQDGYYNS